MKAPEPTFTSIAGLDVLAMDVKVGSGAFMPSYEKSVELAESIVKVGMVPAR